MQTVVCPKCKFTAAIPAVGSKVRLRCQECGHKFIIKPDPQLKKLIKKGGGKAVGGAPKAKAPKEKKPLPKGAVIALAVVLVLVFVLFVGPIVLPGIIPSLLPF